VRTLLRGVLRQDDGQTTVTTTGPQGSGILRSMSLANCLIDIPEDTEHLQPGDSVQVMLL
jgi:molybdopterin molybdotransferase